MTTKQRMLATAKELIELANNGSKSDRLSNILVLLNIEMGKPPITQQPETEESEVPRPKRRRPRTASRRGGGEPLVVVSPRAVEALRALAADKDGLLNQDQIRAALIEDREWPGTNEYQVMGAVSRMFGKLEDKGLVKNVESLQGGWGARITDLGRYVLRCIDNEKNVSGLGSQTIRVFKDETPESAHATERVVTPARTSLKQEPGS